VKRIEEETCPDDCGKRAIWKKASGLKKTNRCLTELKKNYYLEKGCGETGKKFEIAGRGEGPARKGSEKEAPEEKGHYGGGCEDQKGVSFWMSEKLSEPEAPGNDRQKTQEKSCGE